jgi:hypothetical protein
VLKLYLNYIKGLNTEIVILLDHLRCSEILDSHRIYEDGCLLGCCVTQPVAMADVSDVLTASITTTLMMEAVRTSKMSYVPDYTAQHLMGQPPSVYDMINRSLLR